MSSRQKSFFERTSHPYYIASPAFRQTSGGVRALHYFCHALNESGHEAYMATEPGGTSPYLRTPELTQDVIKRHKASGCVPIGVYPEVAHGNMLGLAVAARWILNKPGHLGGDTFYGNDEILFYWDEWMIDSSIVADKLNIPIIDLRIFNNRNITAKREGFCYYANKYFKTGQPVAPMLIENGVSLCLSIPRSPQEIAEILRSSEVFYCYEPSSLVLEALACGCPVAMIDTPYLNEFKWDKNPIFRIKESDIGKIKPPETDDFVISGYFQRINTQAWLQIENFIAKTQAAAQIQAQRHQTPEYQLEEAIKTFQRNEIESATNALAPLLDTLPDNPLPPAYLAFICAARGMPQEAQEFMGRTMEIAPHRIDLKAALGESYLKAGYAELAAACLQDAVDARADMFSAYPALAQSLHLTGKTAEAVNLLQMAASLPGQTQEAIRSTLLELLVRLGDIEGFCEASRRFSRGLGDDLLAARHLGRIDTSGEQCVEALLAAQERLATLLAQTQPNTDTTTAGATTTSKLRQTRRIAFLCSDFARESLQRRLAALLQHLSPEQFATFLIIDDAHAGQDEYAQFCSLLADRSEVIFGQDDASALAQINALAPDFLIDLDGYGASQRLPVFANAEARHKLLWGESPLPPLDPAWLCVSGASADAQPGGLTLPGLGECLWLPELPFNPPAQETLAPLHGTRFACLTPAIRIPRGTWQLFAQVLGATPGSHLTLNLHDLDATAETFIRQIFVAAGIAPEQLDFVHADSLDAVCRHWQQADIGLAPPVDAGEIALPCCLWMGRPYIALASPLPWSQRPAALLAAVGANEWLADTPEEFIALSTRTPPAANPNLRTALQQLGLTDPAAFASGFAAAITTLGEAALTEEGQA